MIFVHEGSFAVGPNHGETVSDYQETAENIVQKMKLNGSVDPEISSELTQIRSSEKHSEKEFFTGVLELARVTSLTVISRQEIAKRHNSPGSMLRR